MPAKSKLVVKKVVEKLSPHSGVSALVLVGSRVEGSKFPPDEFSDIELYVVAYDEQLDEVQKEVESIQHIFDTDEVVLAYKNQWAGWSVLFSDLLRLELPLVKSSDAEVFSRPEEQKIEMVYAKPKFELNRRKKTKDSQAFSKKDLEEAIKDFWYMAVYTAQHIARGEIWLARDAVRISMQGKVKRLLQEVYHQDTLSLERDRRIESTWSDEELQILRDTSCAYDREDLIRAYWENIKYTKQLLGKFGMEIKSFEEYENKLVPRIKVILD